jgi:hypothetical protein
MTGFLFSVRRLSPTITRSPSSISEVRVRPSAAAFRLALVEKVFREAEP